MSLEQHAKAQGIVLSTVKNHLQNLYEKTDTHRQGRLVALLLDTASSW